MYAGYSDEGVIYSSFDNPIVRTPGKAKAIIGVVNLCLRARFTGVTMSVIPEEIFEDENACEGFNGNVP